MISSQLIQNVLESAPDAIIICDDSGAIVFANREAGVLFGYPSDELIGRQIEQLLPERFRAKHWVHRGGYTRSPRARPMGAGLELHALRKDGTEFPVEISLSPIRDADHLLVAAAIRDATDRRRIEAELVAAREAAERANLAKSRFLATASHDLRQPLQTLALLNGALQRLPADAMLLDALIEQEQAIRAMSRLVNALLDISKLEAGAIKPEVTDFTVATIFEQLRREFAYLALDKGIELRIEPCADRVRADPSLVEQILRNLTSNAIKYTRQGMVLLRCLHEAASIRIEVLDTGIGIPADHIPFIYDEFYQVGVQPNANRDGYGLGLSIVSRLVKLLGLTLEVRSQPGKGSSFSLRLPSGGIQVPPEQTSSGPRLMASRPRAVPRRVLLVDDDAGVRRAMLMLLAGEGYEVTAVGSRAEALEMAAADARFDLLIADYHLGGGETGVAVIEALRARYGSQLGSILLSGDTSTAVKDLQRDARLRIASKPIRAEHLLMLVAELLGEREAPCD